MWVRVAAPPSGSFLLLNLAPRAHKTTKNVSTKRQRWFSENSKTSQSLGNLLKKENEERLLQCLCHHSILLKLQPVLQGLPKFDFAEEENMDIFSIECIGRFIPGVIKSPLFPTPFPFFFATLIIHSFPQNGMAKLHSQFLGTGMKNSSFPNFGNGN